MTDEFLGILQRRIIRRDFDLREHRDYVARTSRLAKRIPQRLLEHVSDPAGSSGDEYAERKRRNLAPRLLVADELITNLWTISVDDDYAPSIKHEIDNGPEARARMAKLIRDCRVFARRRERVAADGNHCGA